MLASTLAASITVCLLPEWKGEKYKRFPASNKAPAYYSCGMFSVSKSINHLVLSSGMSHLTVLHVSNDCRSRVNNAAVKVLVEPHPCCCFVPRQQDLVLFVWGFGLKESLVIWRNANPENVKGLVVPLRLFCGSPIRVIQPVSLVIVDVSQSEQKFIGQAFFHMQGIWHGVVVPQETFLLLGSQRSKNVKWP